MEKIGTEGIPESMLRALYARARESKSENHHIYDAKAIELAERLDGKFPEGEEPVMGNGALARAILMDKMVSEYVREHPDGVIVHLACGMDTLFYRVDNGSIRWYDLDLPEVTEARRRVFGAEDRVVMIAKSVTDDDWVKEVKADGPVLIIVEELTMYLDKESVQKLLQIIDAGFGQAEVFLEAASSYTVKNSVEKTEEGSRRKYSFGVKNKRELRRLAPGFKIVDCVTFMEGLREMYPVYHTLRHLPPLKRVANKIFVLRKNV